MKEIFNRSAQIAAEIVENGGEISRAEECVIKICENAGAKKINVFIIPSLILPLQSLKAKDIRLLNVYISMILISVRLKKPISFPVQRAGQKFLIL